MTLVELKDRIGQYGEIKLTWGELEGWRLVVTTERGTWIGQSGTPSSTAAASLDELCERAAKVLGAVNVQWSAAECNPVVRQWS
jgi:hypothetical protein